MSTIFKLMGIAAIATGIQLAASGVAYASVASTNGDGVGAATASRLMTTANSSTLNPVLQDEQTPPYGDIGSPGRTQGSGTR